LEQIQKAAREFEKAAAEVGLKPPKAAVVPATSSSKLAASGGGDQNYIIMD
jgi:hypothetical protein